MSEGYVQAPPDSSGKKLRTIVHDEIHSQTVVLVDPTTGVPIDPRIVTVSGILSAPPTGMKKITNMYWNPETQELITVIED